MEENVNGLRLAGLLGIFLALVSLDQGRLWQKARKES